MSLIIWFIIGALIPIALIINDWLDRKYPEYDDEWDGFYGEG